MNAAQKPTLKTIFRPGIKVDLVFNVDSLKPIIRPAKLYDCDPANACLVVSQTLPETLPSFRYRTLDLTTLVTAELNEKFRFGVRCKALNFLKDYRLSGGNRENALEMTCEKNGRTLNIRTAFRFEPDPQHDIDGLLTYRGVVYASPAHFSIHNISFSGIGLKVPLHLDKQVNPLMQIDPGDRAELQLRLVGSAAQAAIPIPAIIEVVRKTDTFNRLNGFLGARFVDLPTPHEEAIVQFIQRAQRYRRQVENRLD